MDDDAEAEAETEAAAKVGAAAEAAAGASAFASTARSFAWGAATRSQVTMSAWDAPEEGGAGLPSDTLCSSATSRKKRDNSNGGRSNRAFTTGAGEEVEAVIPAMDHKEREK
jgi:hypothetical protein